MRRALVGFVALETMLLAAPAHAFCGFYVGRSAPRPIGTSTVWIARDADRVALTIQNAYEGAAEDLAFVMPVPASVRASDVHAVAPAVLGALAVDAAPALIDLREDDPCPTDMGTPERMCSGNGGLPDHGPCHMGCADARDAPDFVPDTYAISLSPARTPEGVARELAREGYVPSAEAMAALGPYLRVGMRALVARVRAPSLRRVAGRVELPPLQIRYRSRRLALPIAPGLQGAMGSHDLFIHVLDVGVRYEVANRDNLTVPTALDVAESARERFPRFYTALFDRVAARSRGVVVTEYAGGLRRTFDVGAARTLGLPPRVTLASRGEASRVTARPLPGADAREGSASLPLRRAVLRVWENALGCVTQRAPARTTTHRLELDVAVGANGVVTARRINGAPNAVVDACIGRVFSGMQIPPAESAAHSAARFTLEASTGYLVLTRLHLRHEAGAPLDDLVLREASPIAGGAVPADADEATTHEATAALGNAFRARYFVRTAWAGAVTCEPRPRRRWLNRCEPCPQSFCDERSAVAEPWSTSRNGAFELSTTLRTRAEGLPAPTQ